MTVDEAYSMVSRAIDSGRPARGYLIEGDVRGNCSELARRILVKLFPGEAEQAAAGTHPDVVSLEPEGKSRVITVDAMRRRIVEPMSATAFSGGWKVGIVNGADRLRTEAANAFLKSLEEPTPLTMYLLLTDRPDALLPTVVSRTQRISLPMPPGMLEGADFDEGADAVAAKDAAALSAKLREHKEDAPDEDAAFVRQSFYRTLLSFVRKMMLSGAVPRHLAFRSIEAVEDAYRQSERSLNDDAVLSFMLDRIAWPEGRGR